MHGWRIMHKRTIPIVFALLAAAMALLSSCAGRTSADDGCWEEAPDEITAPAPDPDGLKLSENGVSDFVIVYPADFDTSIRTAALSLRDSIREYTGAELAVRSDRTDSENSIDTSYEILLGPTNRDASIKTIAGLRSRDYCVAANGSKIVLGGITVDSVEKAVSRFVLRVLAEGMKGGDDTPITFTEEDNYTYIYKGYTVSSCTFPGGDLSTYQIVYSEHDLYSAERAARLFQDSLSKKAGYALAVLTDEAAGRDETGNRNEIVFGATDRGGPAVSERHGFSVAAQGKKLFVSAECVEGYEAALAYLTDTLLGSDTVEIEDGFLHTGSAVIDENLCMEAKTGEYRVLFNNIYGQNTKQCPIDARMQMLAELHNEYRPDVIGLQERTPGAGQYTRQIKACGYAEVPAAADNSSRCNYTPLFYRAETLDLIDHGWYLYENAVNDESKSLTWAVFRNKIGEDMFAVVSTHLYHKAGTEGNGVRLAQAARLFDAVKAIAAKYDCPVIVGGDLNCNIRSEPFALLGEAGFENLQKLAADTHDLSTHHDYPTYNSALDLFTGMSAPARPYSQAIDHALAYNGDGLSATSFRVITHDYALLSTDHCPVLVDFDVNP